MSISTPQPVLDFHARLAPRPGSRDRLLATMDACGIERTVVCAGGTIDIDRLSRQLVEGGHIQSDADNDGVLDACADSEGRLVPFWFANPHRDALEYQSRAGQFSGLEISPAVHGVTLTEERTTTLVEVAARVGHPVYVVCLNRTGCGVADLVALASAHPGVEFVLGHAGIGNIDYLAVDLVRSQANVWFETSGGYSSVVRAALERLGPSRLLFGTEYPLQHPRVELTKFETLELTPECWQQIAWENANRLLGELQS